MAELEEKLIQPQPDEQPASAAEAAAGVNHEEASAKPRFVTVPPKVIPIGSYGLPFSANDHIAFSDDGVVIEQFSTKRLAQFKLDIHNDEGASSVPVSAFYTKEWDKYRPDEMRASSTKVLLPDGRLVTRYYGVNLTLIYRPHMIFPTTVNKVKTDDVLIAALPPDRLVYFVSSRLQSIVRSVQEEVGIDTDNHNGNLAIYRISDHKHLHTLKQSVKSYRESVCQHAASQWIAVVSHFDKTLAIYNSKYKLKYPLVDLAFEPHWINAVASVNDVIVINANDENNILYMYSWEGNRLQRVSVEEMGFLGYIKGIGGGGADTLQMAYYNVSEDASSLRVFKLVHPKEK